MHAFTHSYIHLYLSFVYMHSFLVIAYTLLTYIYTEVLIHVLVLLSILSLYLSYIMHDILCHAPNPGPTRLADPNRFPGRETQDWDSLPVFFFKTELIPVGMTHTYNNSKYYIQVKGTTTRVVSIKIYTHITESHLHIQN